MNKLAIWRATRKLTVRQLAEKAGLNPATVSRIELGKVKANVLTLGKLADALEIPITELAELAESPKENRLLTTSLQAV
jgi:transcriptional regulator with XRE-family HTH domain